MTDKKNNLRDDTGKNWTQYRTGIYAPTGIVNQMTRRAQQANQANAHTCSDAGGRSVGKGTTPIVKAG